MTIKARFYESNESLACASVQIGAQVFVEGKLKPWWSGRDASNAAYQGAYSHTVDVTLMVHPTHNPVGVNFPLKLVAGEPSKGFLFDYIVEAGTTGVLTDVYVHPY